MDETSDKRPQIEKINLPDKLDLITETWSPKIVAELNGQQVRLARLQGEYVWHTHENEDELFLVIDGSLTIMFRDRRITLKEGEMIVVPRGIQHKPVAEEECRVMLFEPATTRNTGAVDHKWTVEPDDLERI